MYNVDKKLEYEEYCHKNGDTRSFKYFEYLFDYCEEFEIEFGKDVSEFTSEEISKMYSDDKKFKTLNVLIVKNSQYNRYANWATDGNSSFAEYTRDVLRRFVNIEDRNKKIVTREDVLEVVDSFINYSDQLLVLGIFEGLKGNNFRDLLNIKIQNVNFTINTVDIESRLDGFVHISDKLAGIIKKCMSERGYTNTLGFEYAYEPSDYIYKYRSLNDDIRTLDPDDASHKLRTHYNYVTKDTKLKDISVVDLQESGKIWFMWCAAEYNGVTPLDFAIERSTAPLVRNQFGMSFYRKGLFLKKYRDFLE